jgi:hypothetical protein
MLKIPEAPLVIVADAITRPTLFQRIWPSAFLILGLGITVAWTAVFGYGFVALVGMLL